MIAHAGLHWIRLHSTPCWVDVGSGRRQLTSCLRARSSIAAEMSRSKISLTPARPASRPLTTCSPARAARQLCLNISRVVECPSQQAPHPLCKQDLRTYACLRSNAGLKSGLQAAPHASRPLPLYLLRCILCLGDKLNPVTLHMRSCKNGYGAETTLSRRPRP